MVQKAYYYGTGKHQKNKAILDRLSLVTATTPNEMYKYLQARNAYEKLYKNGKFDAAETKALFNVTLVKGNITEKDLDIIEQRFDSIVQQTMLNCSKYLKLLDK